MWGGVFVCWGAFVNASKRGHTLVNEQVNMDTPPNVDACYAQEIKNSTKTCLKRVHLWRGMDVCEVRSTVCRLISGVCVLG